MKNKLVRAAVSFVLAVTLWLFVVTVYRTETEQTFNVPVILDGESVLEDRGLMLVGDKDLMVQLKLNGNRSELSKLRGSDITVLVDLTRIYEAGEKNLEYTISFPGDIRNGSIEVVNRNPSFITLTIAEYATKEIPLEAEVTGTPAEGFEIDRSGITMNGNATGHIRIEGAKNVLDRVATAKVRVDMTDAKESYSGKKKVELFDANGNYLTGDLSNVNISQYEVSLTVPLLKQKTVDLKPIVTAGNGLTGQDVTLSLDMTTIVLAGRPSAIDKLPDVIEVQTFDLGQTTQNAVQMFDVDLSAYPGVRISTAETNRSGKVEATLVLPGKGQKTFDVVLTKNNVINVPVNRTATFSGADSMILEVTLEGWTSVLDRMSLEDIIVVIDVKDGMSKVYIANVSVSQTFSESVKVCGNYEVSIRLNIGSQ